MKKLTAALLLSALLLCACSTDEVPSDDTETSASETGTTAVSDQENTDTTDAPKTEFVGYALTVNQVRLLPGEAADIEALLGKPADKLEAPSCIHPGNDIVYYYDGLEIVTSPSASGSSYITSVTVTDEEIKTEEGIAIGSDFADASKAYGTYDGTKSSPDFGRYVFLKGKTSLTLMTDPDGAVMSITYSFEG